MQTLHIIINGSVGINGSGVFLCHTPKLDVLTCQNGFIVLLNIQRDPHDLSKIILYIEELSYFGRTVSQDCDWLRDVWSDRALLEDELLIVCRTTSCF